MKIRNGAGRLVAVAVVGALLSGCATMPGMPDTSQLTTVVQWVPLVDMKSVNKARYEKDYGECVALAQANPDTTADVKKKAMKWGLGGAAAVGALTVVTGGAALLPLMAAPMAATAVAGGGGAGYYAKAKAENAYRVALGTCLSGRGYTILN